MILYITLAFWFGILHRYRGTSYPLRIRNVWWCWLGIPILLYALGLRADFSIIVGLGYLLWSAVGIMRWASLGHTTAAYGMGRPLTLDEKIVEYSTPGWSPAWKLFARGVIYMVPLALALWLIVGVNPAPLLIVPPATVLAYWLGWKYAPKDYVGSQDISMIAEPIVGIAWGLAVAMIVGLS